MYRERFLIRTIGGPHPGNARVCREGERYGNIVISWPLPLFLPDIGGCYMKTKESQLPPQEEGSFVVRGAEYEWTPEREGT